MIYPISSMTKKFRMDVLYREQMRRNKVFYSNKDKGFVFEDFRKDISVMYFNGNVVSCKSFKTVEEAIKFLEA